MPIHRYCYRVIVRLRRTRGSAVNGHDYGGCGSWLQRRQPSTMSAGCFLGFDTCGAPPPSMSLRGWLCRQRQEKEKRFCKCFCRLFFKQLRRWGKGWGVLVKARSGRNTRTSVFLVVPCNYRPTETRFRWAIVDGERLLITQKLFRKSVPYVGLLWFKSMIFNII